MARIVTKDIILHGTEYVYLLALSLQDQRTAMQLACVMELHIMLHKHVSKKCTVTVIASSPGSLTFQCATLKSWEGPAGNKAIILL